MSVTSHEGQGVTAYILNLLDLAFTLYALSPGARELNPLMQSVPIMIAYKVFVIGAICWVLHRLRKYRLSQFGLNFATAIFAVVDVWHIFNLLWRC